MSDSPETPKASPPRPSLEDSARSILRHLMRTVRGEDIGKLADVAGISVASARKVVSLLSSITNILGDRPRVAIMRSNRGTIVAARFEISANLPPSQIPALAPVPASAVPAPPAISNASVPATVSPKPSFALSTTDADAIQKLARLYLSTGRAFPPTIASEVDALRIRCPLLFAKSSSGNGDVPTPALLSAAKLLKEYASLGRLPESVETASAVLRFTRAGGTPA